MVYKGDWYRPHDKEKYNKNFDNIKKKKSVFVIVASGPSLTKEQCSYIKRMRDAWKCKIIAVNRSHEMIKPDILYAADRRWWLKYHKDTPKCIKITQCKNTAKSLGLRYIEHQHGHLGIIKNPELIYGKQSGSQAINVAYHEGAEKIILVGFDMQSTGGKVHWHEDYEGTKESWANGPGKWEDWTKGMPSIAEDLEAEGVEVINCTISTALTCFKQMTLEEAFNAL